MAKTASLHGISGSQVASEDASGTDAVLEVCDAVGAFIEYWGFKEVHGRVWTFMVLHDAPVAQAHIARTLGLSRASVSIAIKELGEYGLVKRVGSQRLSPFEAVVDGWPIIVNVLASRERVLLERAEQALIHGVKSIRNARASGQSPQFSEERLLVLLSLTDMAKAGLAAILKIRLPPSIGPLRKRFDSLKGMLKVVRLWS